MAHTYLLFDFGADEEKAQLARHKLEGWKQAFRLDQKLLYKLERPETPPKESAEAPAKAADAPKSEKSKSKAKSKSSEAETPPKAAPANGKVHLLVRLYFSGHEKLTEQRWIERIPAEPPFKEASPRVVRQGEAPFEDVVKQFESLE